jgi:hypothetical protein
MRMSEVKLSVDAGVCRFKTKIHAVGADDFTVTFKIESDCPSVRKLAEALGAVDAMDAVSSKIIENGLMAKCSEYLPHPACVIPSALVKAVEVACDLGLKKNVTITFE